MKKILLIFAVMSLFTAIGQNIEKRTIYDYKLNFVKSPTVITSGDILARGEWDFSKLDLKNTTIKIEVISIKDCHNSNNATRYKEDLSILIDNTSNKSKGFKDFSHLTLMTKCFKWRVIINGQKGEEISDWNFYSFI